MEHSEQANNCLLQACKNGQADVVEFLLHFNTSETHDNTTYSNIKDSTNKTPLMFASEKGHLNIVKLLLDYNANLELKDNDSLTALLYAVKNNHLEIITFLVNIGATINLQDASLVELATEESLKLLSAEKTPFKIDYNLFLESAVTHNWISVLKVLIDNDHHKTNTNIFKIAIKNNSVEIVSLLIEHGYKPSNTDLIIAIHIYNFEIIELVLNTDINLENYDKHGFTALMYAIIIHSIAKEPNVDIIKLLIDKGSNVNHRCFSGFTPLLIALDNNNLYASQLLLQNGADMTIKNNDGKDAFTINDKLDTELGTLLTNAFKELKLKELVDTQMKNSVVSDKEINDLTKGLFALTEASTEQSVVPKDVL